MPYEKKLQIALFRMKLFMAMPAFYVLVIIFGTAVNAVYLLSVFHERLHFLLFTERVHRQFLFTGTYQIFNCAVRIQGDALTYAVSLCFQHLVRNGIYCGQLQFLSIFRYIKGDINAVMIRKQIVFLFFGIVLDLIAVAFRDAEIAAVLKKAP